MPTARADKATAKRTEITGTGKLRCRRQGSSHLQRNKSKRVLRALDKDEPVAKAEAKPVRRILGLRTRKKS